MTREDALEKAKHYSKVYHSICVDAEGFWAAVIEALSQEPCIYDLKNRYCPRLNEHGMLTYPQDPTFDDECQKDMDEAWEQIQKKRKRIPVTLDLTPCEDAISREDAIGCLTFNGHYDTLNEVYERLKKLPSVTPSRHTDIEIRDLKLQIASKDQVVEDIKNDIRHIVDEESENDERWARGLHYALCIIEKHWNSGAEMESEE